MVQDWLSLLIRWAHIIAAISWIGSSFYFMWLDASLRRRAGQPEGVLGESWSVHGGGFYHVQKYAVAPQAMPDDLHWFKWESYLTWLSGFALMSVVYYWGASSYMIDPSVAVLEPEIAVMLSVAGLALGWIGYDRLCKSRLREAPAVMFAVLFAAICALAWAYGQVFSGRAVFIQVGAMIATCMTGNVFLVIIPNQKVVVTDLKAGRVPDARYGKIANLRSTHNNYLTLPVVFFMISNHYPSTFGHQWNWLVVAFVLALGAIVRHWFNLHEAGVRGRPILWQWPVSGALAAGLLLLPAWRPGGTAAAGAVTEARAMEIVMARCTGCHAEAPTMEGFEASPGGVRLDTPAEVRAHADAVLTQAVRTRAMPLGNVTGMTDAERAELGAWLEKNGG
ncbi:MAG TPA: urate hydroxylase PuuD [Thermohalobaculum sp.]|nr:urate hydroxylase PuuD [Thermohalobaculum sp.]